MGTLRHFLDALGPAQARRNAAAALDARRAEEAVLDAALQRLELRERAAPAAA